MTYASVFAAIGLGIGIAMAPVLPVPALALWIAMLCALGAVVALRRAPRWSRMAGLLLVVLLLGILRCSQIPAFPDWLIRRAPGIREATGTVASYPNIGDTSISFTLTPNDLPACLQVTWLCEQPLGQVHFGDTVCVRGSAQLPEAFDGFDYPAYLARRNVFATVFADGVVLFDAVPKRFSVWAWGDRVRQRLLASFRAVMSAEISAMAQSLMFGDRSALPEDIEEAFSRTGLMHLLAVSGLHLGIFLGGAWWGLRLVGARPRVAYPIVGLLVLVALVVVGPRVSLVRAALLFAFLALGSVLADCGLILRRWIHSLNGLASAAIAILLIRPGALYDAGFQLTMAATGSILIAFSASGWGTHLLSRPRIVRLRTGWLWLARLLVVSAAAQAGAAPVIAWHFQAFHPLSVAVNLVAVPLAGLSLWAGLLAVFLSATRVATVATIPFVVLLGWLKSIVCWLARSPVVEWVVCPGIGIWMAGCAGYLYLVTYYESLSSWTSNLTSMESDPAED